MGAGRGGSTDGQSGCAPPCPRPPERRRVYGSAERACRLKLRSIARADLAVSALSKMAQLSVPFCQSSANPPQASMASSCFPSDIDTAFSEIGLSAGETAAFCSYVGGSPLSLAVAGVRPEELLVETSDLTAAPEPAPWRVVIGPMLMLLWVHRSRHRKRGHYAEATGQTPARAVQRLRVEVARLLLSESRLPVTTGLGSHFGCRPGPTQSTINAFSTKNSSCRFEILDLSQDD